MPWTGASAGVSYSRHGRWLHPNQHHHHIFLVLLLLFNSLTQEEKEKEDEEEEEEAAAAAPALSQLTQAATFSMPFSQPSAFLPFLIAQQHCWPILKIAAFHQMREGQKGRKAAPTFSLPFLHIAAIPPVSGN